MQVEKFLHDNQELEIRIIAEGEIVFVRAFRDNNPANQFRYSATNKDIHDLATVVGTDAVKHLIESAKQDIVSGLN